MNWDLKGSLRITERPPAKSPAMLLVQKCIAVPANATQGETRGTWLGILRTSWATWQTHALALADQAVVSGTSFLTMVVVGRSTSASELGLYSIASSLLVTSVTIQDSLISLPYTIQRHRPLGKSAEHSDSSLKLSFLLSALCIVVLALTVVGLSSWNAEAKLVAMIWALAAVAPFALLGAFGGILTVALVWCLVPRWGLLGAACGFLAGTAIRAAGRWVAFLALVPRHGPEADPRTLPDACPRTIGSDSISAPLVPVLSRPMDARVQDRTRETRSELTVLPAKQ